MREILFRGRLKAENGELKKGDWVYGDLVTLIDGKEKHLHIYGKGEVKAETIRQFTGLTDKNGTKIFDGDVVKAVIVRDLGGGTENRQETGIIAYDKIGMIGLFAKYAGSIPIWSDFFQELTLSGCINDFWFEIICNINDNPELLESEVQGE